MRRDENRSREADLASQIATGMRLIVTRTNEFTKSCDLQLMTSLQHTEGQHLIDHNTQFETHTLVTSHDKVKVGLTCQRIPKMFMSAP